MYQSRSKQKWRVIKSIFWLLIYFGREIGILRKELADQQQFHDRNSCHFVVARIISTMIFEAFKKKSQEHIKNTSFEHNVQNNLVT